MTNLPSHKVVHQRKWCGYEASGLSVVLGVHNKLNTRSSPPPFHLAHIQPRLLLCCIFARPQCFQFGVFRVASFDTPDRGTRDFMTTGCHF